MEKDKRSLYVWIMVLIANIGTVITIILINIYDSPYGSFELWDVFKLPNSIGLGISLFATVTPILISKSNIKSKNRFGYGIPILLLLPLPYFIYDYYTCTGKFCEIVPMLFGITFGLSAIFFALFYTLGIRSRNWTEKYILSLMRIEIILLVVFTIYLGSNTLNRVLN